MIRKSQIMFDAHSQTAGSMEARFVGEELLTEKGPLQVTSSLFFRLPFRLRVGDRVVFQVNGIVPARITVVNSVDIPNVQVQQELLGQVPRVRPEMASDVLVTLSSVMLDEDRKAAIVRALSDPDYSKASADLRYLHVDPEEVLKPINSLLVSYRVLFGQEVQWNRVRRILRKDISGNPVYELHVFTRQHDTVLHQIEEGLAGTTPTSLTPFLVGGALHDLPMEGIAKLQHDLTHNTHYAFYSMAIQAEDYIHQTDYLNALLYSVIAFENAHAELIEHVIETKVGCSAARSWAQELLRQAGISAMVRLTPSLFMEPANRPSQAQVDGVVRAIQIRNELAHAKRDNNRNLKVDNHKSDDLLPLIEAVMAYINAIARQLPD